MARRILKWIGVILLLLALAPVLAYVVYDLTQFQPRRDEIAAIIEAAAPQERQPPSSVLRMLAVSAPNGSSPYANRLLMLALESRTERRMGYQHIAELLWWSLMRLHLSEAEQVTIFLTLAPTGPDRKGFSKTAAELFQRDPSELTVDELATLFALIRHPMGKAQRIESIKATLLERYQAAAP